MITELKEGQLLDKYAPVIKMIIRQESELELMKLF